MELTVKFTLDDSWQDYHATDEQRLEALLRHDLDGVQSEIIKPNTEDDTFILKDEFGELHRAPKMAIPCDICKYGQEQGRACGMCYDNNPLNSYYKITEDEKETDQD